MTLQPETREPSNDPRGLNRRTVLKAGAHAAWAIPAVQVITQAPALAASGAASLTCGGTGSWTGSSSADATFPCHITVSNANSGLTSGLTLRATFPNGWTPTILSAPAGWTVDTMGPSQTFLFTASSQLGQGSKLLDVTFKPQDASNVGKSVSVTLQPQTTGGTATAGALAVAAAPFLTFSAHNNPSWGTGNSGKFTLTATVANDKFADAPNCQVTIHPGTTLTGLTAQLTKNTSSGWACKLSGSDILLTHDGPVSSAATTSFSVDCQVSSPKSGTINFTESIASETNAAGIYGSASATLS